MIEGVKIFEPRPAPAEWTEAEEALLRQLWDIEGLTASACAARIGKSRNAILTKRSRMNLSSRKVHDIAHTRPKPKRPAAAQRPLRKPAKTAGVPPDARPLCSDAWKALAGTAPVSLVDLESGMCKWPIGESKPYLFCGLHSGDSSYCEHHRALAKGKGTERERAAHRAREKVREIA